MPPHAFPSQPCSINDKLTSRGDPHGKWERMSKVVFLCHFNSCGTGGPPPVQTFTGGKGARIYLTSPALFQPYKSCVTLNGDINKDPKKPQRAFLSFLRLVPLTVWSRWFADVPSLCHANRKGTPSSFSSNFYKIPSLSRQTERKSSKPHFVPFEGHRGCARCLWSAQGSWNVWWTKTLKWMCQGIHRHLFLQLTYFSFLFKMHF